MRRHNGYLTSALLAISLYRGVRPALAQDSWQAAAPMPTRRADLITVTGTDGRLYVIDGRTSNGAPSVALRLLEIYDPTANRWVTGTPPSGGHYGGRATLGL